VITFHVIAESGSLDEGQRLAARFTPRRGAEHAVLFHRCPVMSSSTGQPWIDTGSRPEQRRWYRQVDTRHAWFQDVLRAAVRAAGLRA
jgi:hypothetical protein